jgi:transcription elongation factor GreB
MMSKAFTRESDDEPDVPAAALRQPPPLPAGAKNYVTERGARLLREERDHLLNVERPRITAIADAATRTAELQALGHRLTYLQQSLSTAVVVSPPSQPWEIVRFGATVTARDTDGTRATYRIVGVDEADFDRGWVSWCSPIARALLNARKSQRLRFEAPDGVQQLEVLEISYDQ